MLFIPISGALLLSTCLGHPSPNQNDGKTVKPFICKSGISPQTARKEANMSSSELATRSFLLNRDDQWPRGYVPYEIDRSFSKKQMSMIMKVIEKLRRVSCVRWVPRYKQKDYVGIIHVEERGRCSATVGRVGGKQTIKFNDDCFDVDKGYKGAILHEMMHAIGFIHEQQRLDRNCYVKVAKEAVEQRPFDYATINETSLDFPYDFGSIMHYGESGSMRSARGKKLGNLEGELTEMDIMKLNFMYCKGKTYCELQPANCKQFQEAEQLCLIHLKNISN